MFWNIKAIFHPNGGDQVWNKNQKDLWQNYEFWVIPSSSFGLHLIPFILGSHSFHIWKYSVYTQNN